MFGSFMYIVLHCFNCRPSDSVSGMLADRSWEYINCSQIHECRNWEWGRAVSFLAVHKSDFLYSVAHRAGVNRHREAVAAVAWCKGDLAAPMVPLAAVAAE